MHRFHQLAEEHLEALKTTSDVEPEDVAQAARVGIFLALLSISESMAAISDNYAGAIERFRSALNGAAPVPGVATEVSGTDSQAEPPGAAGAEASQGGG